MQGAGEGRLLETRDEITRARSVALKSQNGFGQNEPAVGIKFVSLRPAQSLFKSG